MADNPQAFPTGDHVNGGHDGMSLRDYFAGQALPYAASRSYGNDWGEDGKGYAPAVARFAYRIADAMLTARKDHPHA